MLIPIPCSITLHQNNISVAFTILITVGDGHLRPPFCLKQDILANSGYGGILKPFGSWKLRSSSALQLTHCRSGRSFYDILSNVMQNIVSMYIWEFIIQLVIILHELTVSGSSGLIWTCGECCHCFVEKSIKPFDSPSESSKRVQFPVLEGSMLFQMIIFQRAFLKCSTLGLLFHPQHHLILLNKGSM